MSKIKEARLQAGLTQEKMSAFLNIPKRTIENWEEGQRSPSPWVERLIIQELKHVHDRPFKNYSTAVKNYTDVCVKFAKDTAEWGRLVDNQFYSTNGSDWIETSDNAHGGIMVDWAFHHTETEVIQHAGEMLFNEFVTEIQCAIDNECELEDIQCVVDKFDNF